MANYPTKLSFNSIKRASIVKFANSAIYINSSFIILLFTTAPTKLTNNR